MKEKTTATRPVARHFDTRRMRGEEVEARRNERSKTFALGRGLYQTVVYPERVHYRDGEGGWREIDNRLHTVEEGGPALENAAGPLRIRLGMSAEADPLVTIRDGQERQVSWRLEGANASPAVRARGWKAGEDEDQNRAHADKSVSMVRYREVLPHTDLVYELRGSSLKEDLVLTGPGAPEQFRFTLDAGSLAWEEMEGGGLRLWDAANPGEDVFWLPPPFMVDAAGREGAVLTSWEAEGGTGTLTMTITPDGEFLAQAQYPVVIDPQVQSSQSGSNIKDTYIRKANNGTNYVTATSLWVGKHATYGECKALVKIDDLPDVGKGYVIVKAQMGIALGASNNKQDAYVYAREIMEAWDPTKVTWNTIEGDPANPPETPPQVYDRERYLDYTLVKKGESEAQSAFFDITNLVRKWYADKNQNFGILLESPDEQPISFASGDNGTSAARPVIYVNYVSKAGLESYLAYESFGAGRAGTAHVALHTGHLVATRGLTFMSGNRMPVSLGLTWNACNMDKNTFGVGFGWRLNWNRSLRRQKPATGDYYYMYTDGDGTEHEFTKHVKTDEEKKDIAFVDYYEDRSGLSLKLYEVGTEAEIVSKDHSKLVFEKPTADYTGTPAATTFKMIRRAVDALGNTAAFVHNASFQLTTVTDGAGRVTSLAYTATQVSVTAPGYTAPALLTLDAGKRLTTVTDLDGGRSEYVYGDEPADPEDPNPPTPDPSAANRLRLLRNTVDGTYVKATFDKQGRATQMQVWGQEGEPVPVLVAGNDRSYEYFDCVTQVRDLTAGENGKVLTYQFNDYGNVVAVHDELGFASFAKFSMGKPNTPEAVSKLQRLVINLLDMHDFTGDSGWKTGVIGTDGKERENDVAPMDLKPLRLERPAPKWAEDEETSYAEYLKPCEAGEYTFSVYVRSDGDALAWAELAWKDDNGQWNKVTSERVRRVGAALRLTCTLNLSQAATVRCRVLAAEGRGACWFDRAQLERGALANRHSLLQNANFSTQAAGELPEGWMSAEGSVELPDKEKAVIAPASESTYKPMDLRENCLRLLGAPGKKNGVYQELDIQGGKGDSYVVGGWARAWAAPGGENRAFRLRVSFQKRNGVWADGGTADWNEEWVDWQYACGAAVAPAAYRKVRVYIEYDENLNEAQIGAVSFTKEYYGQNFAYDERNNVTAASTLLGQKDKAEYDKFDNLTSYVQPGREENDKYTFFYGDTDAEKKRHLLLRSETPLGLVSETEYDAFGNATEGTARDKSDGRFMRTYTAYTANGNYAVSSTDARGQTSYTSVDPDKGLTQSVTDVMGQVVSYQYDSANRMTSAETIVGSGEDAKVYRNEYTYDKDRLKTVKHNTTGGEPDVTYTFETDALGNPTTVSVGAQALSTNVYSDSGDKLLEAVEYGNGGKVRYTYDDFKRTTGIRYDDAEESRFTYEYGANGALSRVKDTDLEREARLAYDLAERPVETELYEKGALKYRLAQEYDRFEQPSVLHERIEEPDDTRSEYTISVEYDKESKLTALTYESARMLEAGEPDETSKRKLTYAYDGLGRMAKRAFYADAQSEQPMFQSEYTYAAGGYGANSATSLVRTIEQAGGKHEYWYDERGNIVKESWQGPAIVDGLNLSGLTWNGEPLLGVAEGGSLSLKVASLGARYDTTYAYDALGQLIRVNDQREKATWTYSYDQGGNILEKKRYAYTQAEDLSNLTAAQTIPYVYDDPTWKDKLTAYGGNGITYDAIGNPLSYDGWAYTWKAGRMLHSAVGNGVDAQFTYDHTGLRVKKSANGVDTLYTLNGKKITHIRKRPNNPSGEDATQMHFFYDAQGRPAIVRNNGTDYAYLHNLQGDVTGIVDMDGTPVVQYGYDAWGKPVTSEGSMAETLGHDNPFRYRGYEWDEETGLYYLRSRYYDPQWGRFVNADVVLGEVARLLSHNLSCYCWNAPTRYTDSTGMYADDDFDQNVYLNWKNPTRRKRRRVAASTGTTARQAAAINAILADPEAYDYSLTYDELNKKHTGDEGCGKECEHYRYGIYRKSGIIHVCCAYLLRGIYGGSSSVPKRKSHITGGLQVLTDLSQLVDGMEVYQTKKHCGKVVTTESGELAVFHSSTNGGPVLELLTGIGKWDSCGTLDDEGKSNAFFFDETDTWYMGI